MLRMQLLRRLRLPRPRPRLREGDVQQHHSSDPQVEAVVMARSWVRSARGDPCCGARCAAAWQRPTRRF